MAVSSRTIATVARTVQGAAFLTFGLNGFFHFLPMPPPPPAAGAFFGALFATGYMLPLIKGTEVVAGLMLLSNRFVPLALALIAPVIVNILAFHAFLAPAGLALPLVLLATELVLAWSYRSAFAPMLRARVSPDRATDSEPASIAAHAAA
jgi:putative oxidoreductase